MHGNPCSPRAGRRSTRGRRLGPVAARPEAVRRGRARLLRSGYEGLKEATGRPDPPGTEGPLRRRAPTGWITPGPRRPARPTRREGLEGRAGAGRRRSPEAGGRGRNGGEPPAPGGFFPALYDELRRLAATPGSPASGPGTRSRRLRPWSTRRTSGSAAAREPSPTAATSSGADVRGHAAASSSTTPSAAGAARPTRRPCQKGLALVEADRMVVTDADTVTSTSTRPSRGSPPRTPRRPTWRGSGCSPGSRSRRPQRCWASPAPRPSASGPTPGRGSPRRLQDAARKEPNVRQAPAVGESRPADSPDGLALAEGRPARAGRPAGPWSWNCEDGMEGNRGVLARARAPPTG